MSYEVKSVSVWSVTKIYGVIGLVMGILVGGGMLLFILLASLGVLTAGGKESAAAGFLLGGSGIIASISIMVGYPIMTAISGALAAVFYNLLAMLAGGVVLRLQEKREL